MRPLVRLVVAALAVCAVSACSGSPAVTTPAGGASSGASSADAPAAADDASPSESAATASASAMAAMPGTAGTPGTDGGMAALAAPPAGSPVETAVRLEALMAQHSVLATDMMRARIRGDGGLAQAADAALSTNSTDLAAVLRPVIGATAATAFRAAWAEHIEALFNYARGLSTQDTAVQADARKELQEYEEDLAKLFVTASHGRLSPAAALADVRMHIEHLVAGADAYAAKRYDVSAAMYRTSYTHAFELGGTLARALLPASAGPKLEAPTVALRSALTSRLGEHASLVVAAMRSAVGDRADFDAMGMVLNGNTQDLGAAIESLFGAAAARQFQNQWADHVDQLLAYTSATVTQDTAGQEKARQALRTFEQTFAAFLDGATQHRLGTPALAQAFVMHDRELLAQIDAYSAKQYQQAHDLSDQTYAHMFTVADQLSGAIGATLAGRLPRGGSQTGGGGTAAEANVR